MIKRFDEIIHTLFSLHLDGMHKHKDKGMETAHLIADFLIDNDIEEGTILSQALGDKWDPSVQLVTLPNYVRLTLSGHIKLSFLRERSILVPSYDSHPRYTREVYSPLPGQYSLNYYFDLTAIRKSLEGR